MILLAHRMARGSALGRAFDETVNSAREYEGTLAFCAKCGKELSGDAAFCPECGAPVMPQVQSSGRAGVVTGTKVNTWVAVVSSLIFPGLGQLYLGEKKRGTKFIVIGLVLLGTILIEIGVILYPIFVVINALDAYRYAIRINGANGPDLVGSA